MIRRWLPRAAALLIIGLILNIFVAWLTAMALPIGPSATQAPTKERGFVGSVPAIFGEPSRAWVWRTLTAEYWQVEWDGPDEDEWFKDQTFAQIHRHGFPLRALEVQNVDVGPASLLEYSGPRSRGSIPMPSWHTWLWVDRTRETPYTNQFPWLPIWPGFVVNTLFYALLVLAALLGFSHWRRRRRVRRGRCGACGYDLTGLVDCPECGRANPKAIQETE